MTPDNRALWELVEKWRKDAMKEDCIVEGFLEPEELYIWKCADELAAILERPVVVGGWLPIESAPKMKAVLVGYRNSYGNWRSVKATYYTEGQLMCADEVDDDACDENGYALPDWYEETETHDFVLPLTDEPTHWMPIPEKPGTNESMVRGKS